MSEIKPIIPHIYTALGKVNEELDAIKKDEQGFGYKFRGISTVLNTVSPLFKKYGIITLKSKLEIKREFRTVETAKGPKTITASYLQATYRFVSTVDQSYIETEGFNMGFDSSGGDKSDSIANSTCYRNAILELFNIPTEDQVDNDMQTAKEAEVAEKKGTFTKEDAKKAGTGFRKSNDII